MRAILVILSVWAAVTTSVATERASAAGDTRNVEVKIDGMHCASCVRSVKAALSKIPELDAASVVVTLKENRATVALKEGKDLPKEAIEAAIKKVGYTVTSVTSGEAHP